MPTGNTWPIRSALRQSHTDANPDTDSYAHSYSHANCNAHSYPDAYCYA